MKKQVHKLLDEKGRILIPKEFRQMTEMECGDIVKLCEWRKNYIIQSRYCRNGKSGSGDHGSLCECRSKTVEPCKASGTCCKDFEIRTTGNVEQEYFSKQRGGEDR